VAKKIFRAAFSPPTQIETRLTGTGGRRKTGMRTMNDLTFKPAGAAIAAIVAGLAAPAGAHALPQEPRDAGAELAAAAARFAPAEPLGEARAMNAQRGLFD
jgi:hypothetical protein